jgi:threonyl-tRNA synthetase
MRLLLWHVDYIRVKTKEKALRNPPDGPWDLEEENCLVAFIAGERGDSNLTDRAKGEILTVMKNLGVNKVVLYPYVHLTQNPSSPREAYAQLLELEKALAEETEVKRAPFGWYKSFEVKVKGHPLSELSRKL